MYSPGYADMYIRTWYMPSGHEKRSSNAVLSCVRNAGESGGRDEIQGEMIDLARARLKCICSILNESDVSYYTSMFMLGTRAMDKDYTRLGYISHMAWWCFPDLMSDGCCGWRGWMGGFGARTWASSRSKWNGVELAAVPARRHG